MAEQRTIGKNKRQTSVFNTGAAIPCSAGARGDARPEAQGPEAQGAEAQGAEAQGAEAQGPAGSAACGGFWECEWMALL